MDVRLKDYQEDFKKQLFFRSSAAPRSRLWGNHIPARLDVYRHNTQSNWTDTLDHDFPLTKKQFTEAAWSRLTKIYFIAHPPHHWELNTSMSPFPGFLVGRSMKPWIPELADYEWNDLKVFIDRAHVQKGMGKTNPTAVVRVYQHQMFDWVEAGTPVKRPPQKKPEVLVFYRDAENTCHIQEADPLMLLLMDFFKKPGRSLKTLEKTRKKLLPTNHVPLASVIAKLKTQGLLL